jgi:hypothetical protein
MCSEWSSFTTTVVQPVRSSDVDNRTAANTFFN